MEEIATATEHKPIDAAICIDEVFYHRYRAVLRHLCVGLIDVIPRVRLVSSTPEAELLSLGPIQTIIHSEPRWPVRSRRLRQLLDTLAKTPPTVVHAMSAGAYDVALAIAEEFDADTVYQVTALDDVRTLAEIELRNPFRVICASEPLVERVAEVIRGDREHIRLIRPGVVCAAEPTCFCDPSRAPALLSTASFTAENCIDNLLHAIRHLKQREHTFLTFLLGAGPEENNLRRLTRELGLDSCVAFAQPHGDVLQAMVGADIFVQPAAEESISARSLQALAQGMAVVGVVGGVHDAYRPDETVVLADASTPVDLAAGIERFLLDHDFARRMAAGAIQYMRSHHTMTGMAERTGEVYRVMAVNRATIPLKRGPQSAD